MNRWWLLALIAGGAVIFVVRRSSAPAAGSGGGGGQPAVSPPGGGVAAPLPITSPAYTQLLGGKFAVGAFAQPGTSIYEPPIDSRGAAVNAGGGRGSGVGIL